MKLPRSAIGALLFCLGLVTSQTWTTALFPAQAVESPNSSDADTLQLAVEVDPRSLDPVRAFSNEEGTLCRFLFNTLIEANNAGGFDPVLAETLPEISPDGLTYTFRLKPGIRFSNGTELTAETVAQSFERYFDPACGALTAVYFKHLVGSSEFESARKQEIAVPSTRRIPPTSISGLERLDRLTLRIRLQQPDLAFLHVLGTPAGGIAIPDESSPKKAGRTQPLTGTGPYMLQEWIRGARIRLGRNPHYFRTSEPRCNRVEILVNVHRSVQTMMFEKGELDFVYFFADQDFIRFRRHPQLQRRFEISHGSSPTYVFMNCEMPPFNNRLVRKAMNYAVDKEGLLKLLSHRGSVQRGPLPAVVSGFNSNLFEYAYDPEKAKIMLTNAGFPEGFETTLWAPYENPVWMKIALYVQQSLKQVGVTAHLKTVSFTALNEAVGRRKTVPLCVYNWVTIADDPKETLDSLLNGENIIEQGCMNVAFYSNPAVEKNFRLADKEADAGRRLSLYREIESQVVEDAPWIFLVQLDTEMAVQPWLKGFVPRGFWPPAWLERCNKSKDPQ